MKKEDVLKQYTTPTGAPAFVPGPHRFTSREYLNITYRTDREALVKQVPEPLEVDEPLVRFEVMNMPDTTGYGSYVECGQAAVVRHKEEVGEYIIGMYLDNLPAIAAGRSCARQWESRCEEESCGPDAGHRQCHQCCRNQYRPVERPHRAGISRQSASRTDGLGSIDRCANASTSRCG